MQKLKIVALLGGTSDKERKDFLKHLRKNYNRPNLIKLYQHLSSVIKDKKGDEKLNRNYVLKQVLKGSNLSNKDLLNLASELVGLMEDYLVNEYVQQHPFLGNYLMAKVYQDKKMPDYFEKQLAKIERDTARNIHQKGVGIAHSHEAMLIADLVYFDDRHHDAIEKKESLDTALHFLEEYSTLNKLRYHCELVNRSNVLEGEPYEMDLNSEIEEYKSKMPESTPLFKLYESAYRMLKTKEEPDFIAVKQLLFQKNLAVASEECIQVLGYLINMAVRYNGWNKKEPARELFEIFKSGDEHELLLDHGHISLIRFHNVINVAAFLDEFEWLESFVERYRRFLPPHSREKVEKLSEAQEIFEEGNFQGVCDLLEKLQFSNVYLKVRTKSLLLRSYYENDAETGLIISLCKSFSQMIRREKTLNEKTVRGCLVFINFMKEISLYREQEEVGERHKITKSELLDNLQRQEYLPYREWLSKKIDEL